MASEMEPPATRHGSVYSLFAGIIHPLPPVNPFMQPYLNILHSYELFSAEELDSFDWIDIQDLKEKIQKSLEISVGESVHWDLKASIFVEYYLHAALWAKEEKFSSCKINSFLSILHYLMDNLIVWNYSLEMNFNMLKKLLLALGEQIFTYQENQKIVEYIGTDLFQHYLMYEYITKNEQVESVLTHRLHVETVRPHHLNPLEEALKDATFQAATMAAQSKLPRKSVYRSLSDES